MSQYPLLKVKKPDGRKYITELEKLICQSEPSEITIGRKKTIVLLYQTIRKTDLDRTVIYSLKIVAGGLSIAVVLLNIV